MCTSSIPLAIAKTMHCSRGAVYKVIRYKKAVKASQRRSGTR
jgi:hypothetical protein